MLKYLKKRGGFIMEEIIQKINELKRKIEEIKEYL